MIHPDHLITESSIHSPAIDHTKLCPQAITVYTHHFSRPAYLFKIKASAYSPRPLVDGAFVDFELKTTEERALQQQESKFLSFVRTGLLDVSVLILSA